MLCSSAVQKQAGERAQGPVSLSDPIYNKQRMVTRPCLLRITCPNPHDVAGEVKMRWDSWGAMMKIWRTAKGLGVQIKKCNEISFPAPYVIFYYLKICSGFIVNDLLLNIILSKKIVIIKSEITCFCHTSYHRKM